MNIVHELPARLAEPEPDPDPDLAEHFLESPPAPDWEGLIAAGTVPALALGAERRLHRVTSQR
jgi:hypothetical protein